jgi:ribulose-5-phosphate 4-epimerase/fuculose-1-phosphate aldolase
MQNTVAMGGERVLANAPIGEDERQVRIELAACYRLAQKYGWDEIVFNHISARVPGPDHHFLINPFGLTFEEVTASNLVKVDLEGRIIGAAKYPINAAGFTIHSAVHAARADAMCVLHTHTVAGVAVSCQRQGLLPLNQWSMQFTDRLAYHDYEGIALDLDERARLVADLGDKFVMVLRNHGMLTCGRSVAEAFKLMHNLERSCRAQLAIQASNAETAPLSAAVARKTAGQYANFYDKIEVKGEPDSEWAAFKRMLERTDPDFIN